MTDQILSTYSPSVVDCTVYRLCYTVHIYLPSNSYLYIATYLQCSADKYSTLLTIYVTINLNTFRDRKLIFIVLTMSTDIMKSPNGKFKLCFLTTWSSPGPLCFFIQNVWNLALTPKMISFFGTKVGKLSKGEHMYFVHNTALWVYPRYLLKVCGILHNLNKLGTYCIG